MSAAPRDDSSEPGLASTARRLAERVKNGDLAVERLQLAAHLGDATAAQALSTACSEPPRRAEDLGAWLLPVAQDDQACRRLMLALARALMPTWRSARHLHRDVASVERILTAFDAALEGQSIPQETWADEEERLGALYDVAYGTVFERMPLDDLVTAFMGLVCTALYDDGASVRRDRLISLTNTAQAAAGTTGYASGPLADACRDLATWLLGARAPRGQRGST
jgi:hypothetical protein